EMIEVLERQGIICLAVKDEDRESIVERMDASPSAETEMITSSRQELLTPVRLASRTFWLSDKVSLTSRLPSEKLLDLLKLKAAYEEQPSALGKSDPFPLTKSDPH